MGQVVQKTDLAVLSAYAHSWAEWQKESQLLDREGTITTGAQGQPIQNPRCRVVKDLFNIMAAAASKLGFSPADRDRMKPKEVEKKKNPLEALNA
jgi:P27 family predicted phage terminase small subunit